MSTTISGFWKAPAVALLIACVISGAWLTYHETRTPRNQTEVLNRMIELSKERRYDKAVQVVQNWMKDSRRDSSTDGSLYQQIAIVYIEKAYKKPSTRADSVHDAEASLEKALAFFDKTASGELSLDLYTIGRGYEALGDISDEGKCRYYGEAQQLFVRQLPLIKGDSYTAYGATIPLEPVRVEIQKHLDEVNDKHSKVNCQQQ